MDGGVSRIHDAGRHLSVVLIQKAKGFWRTNCFQVGWLGYSDEKVKSLADRFLREGFTAFKIKVGKDLEDDKRRLRG